MYYRIVGLANIEPDSRRHRWACSLARLEARLSTYLGVKFRDVRGFSSRDIWDMRRFYVTCMVNLLLAQAVRERGRNRNEVVAPYKDAQKRVLYYFDSPNR